MLKTSGIKLATSAAALLLCASPSFAIISGGGSLTDGIPSLVYNSLDGSVWIETGSAYGGPSSIYDVTIESYEGIFNTFNATGVVASGNDYFIQTVFGLELPDGTLLGDPGFMYSGEQELFLLDDLTFTFATQPFGSLFTSDLVYYTGVVDLPGDPTGDGFVGIADLNLVLANWNIFVTPNDKAHGELSGDNYVGIDDLNVVLGNWNAGTPPTSAAVPEPATAALIAAFLGAGVTRRNRG
tara:strand:- start:134 stop:853 length:720 start_codon:yes stop_codon:yes gene_type:complete